MKNIKAILLILMALLAIFQISAQNTGTHNSSRSNQVGGNSGRGLANPGPSAGVSIGTTLAFPSGVNTEISELGQLQPGLDLGAFAELPLGGALAVELAPSYQTRSWSVLLDELQGLPAQKDQYLNSYLNIPVLLNFYLSPGFKVALGPNVDYLLGAQKATSILENGIAGTPTETDIIEQLNRLGAGVNLQITKAWNNGLGIQLRSNINLLDVMKVAPTGELEELFNRNMTMQVNLTYRILGRK